LQLPDFEASEGVGILVPSTLITPSLGPTTASLRRTSSSLRSPTASKNVRRRYNPMAAASPASRRDDSAEATTVSYRSGNVISPRTLPHEKA
ncbi:hypothetical protein BGZ79_004314, partial [Entomortierella chlamydospora]